MAKLNFDPRELISPPFVTCPKCGGSLFGVLMVNGKSYIRRCRDCWFPDPHKDEHHSIPLPPIRKKVIYLDQFAISNMVLALDPESEQHKEGKFAPGTEGERWLTLYKKLYRLYRLQLIICPYSIFHLEESMVAPQMQKKLKRLYELLSHNTSFQSPQDIQHRQMHYFAQCWVKKEEPDFSTMEPESVTRDPIHIWNERIIVTVPHKWSEAKIQAQRKSRQQGYQGLGQIADRWRKEQKTFQQYFVEESTSYGKAVMKTYWQFLLRRYAEVFFPSKVQELIKEQKLEYVEASHPHVQLVHEMHEAFLEAGLRNEQQELPASLVAMFQRLGVPQEKITLEGIHTILQEAGLPDTRAMQKLAELLLSDAFREKVPYIRIQSLLWADLAVSARQSTNDPDQGTFNDIELISTLLPYCDAMMLDKKWNNVLRRKPVCDKLGYGTRIFAPKYMDEFFAYLDSIEAATTPAHLQQVAEVYGEISLYTSIFGLQEVSS